MMHPNEAELLLFVYDELPRHRELESHLATCDACRTALLRLERARVALDDAIPAVPARRPRTDWLAIALAAAAVLAGVLIIRPRPTTTPVTHWTPTTTWSTTAGYVTGGKAMADIDAQLTRLERERYYGLPN
jgi:hypothetical protein